MKNLLPKNPWAAAGLGALVGVGISGYKMWKRYKNGEVSHQEAVIDVVKQSMLFGGVAAISTFAGGGSGGGAGIAALSVLGMRGSGKGQSDLFSGLVLEALEDEPERKRGNRRGQKGALLQELEEEIEEVLEDEP
ncbi:hypothetical protein [Pseudodesulfovibrio sediminis]|uniref:Uncharacterized protein n=1 Tax=Pseudodesulfovibrio sediminis TaxID=2810563 RepID=A0ABM7P5D4_9BACT|nr:hypothetical protein [Pseudodesulfovibrio sediminis]BCS88106.1 hypothetical protein PSDVSF_13480 [Pseudodesulfovibrio sediminis]